MATKETIEQAIQCLHDQYFVGKPDFIVFLEEFIKDSDLVEDKSSSTWFMNINRKAIPQPIRAPRNNFLPIEFPISQLYFIV